MSQGLQNPRSKLSHGYYQPYFYWMFPIVIANDEGLFEKAGVDFSMHDISGQGQPEDKAGWYKQALDTGERDFYFCCAWQGIYSTCQTGRGKIGAAIRSTLIKTFAIYTRPDSGINDVLDLVEQEKPIAVNKNADAHYVTLKNLSEVVPESKVRLAHLGGVEKCFGALADGKVEAATLAGPYAEAAEAIGYRRILALSRTEPTLVVFNENLDRAAAASFLAAINDAISLINDDRSRYKARYLQEFDSAVRRHLPQLVGSLATMKERIALPVWKDASAFSQQEFGEVHSFLLDNGLSTPGRGYEGTVDAGLIKAKGAE